MGRSREVAFCGVMAAMSGTLLLLGGLIPGATYCAPVLGMLPLLPVLSEFGTKAALSVYAVTAVLALLMIPDKELAGIYLFLGYYPALRPALNRLRRPVRILCKLAVFNAAVVTLYALLLHLLGLETLQKEFSEFSTPFLAALLATGNGVFLLLDTALERLGNLWQYHLRKVFFRHGR